MRERFTDTTTDLFEMFEGSIDDPQSAPLIRDHFKRIFDAEFEKAWAAQPVSIRLSIRKEIARELARRQMERLDVRTAMATVIALVKDQIPWDEAAERGHVNGLLKLLQRTEAEPLPAGWRNLTWRVVRMPEACLVLGDCAVFAVRGGAAIPIAAGDTDADPAGFCLPISPTALLVGGTADQTLPTNIAAINRASVVHSFDSFFSARATDVEASLSPMIGEARGLLLPEEMRAIRNSVWRDLDKD